MSSLGGVASGLMNSLLASFSFLVMAEQPGPLPPLKSLLPILCCWGNLQMRKKAY